MQCCCCFQMLLKWRGIYFMGETIFFLCGFSLLQQCQHISSAEKNNLKCKTKKNALDSCFPNRTKVHMLKVSPAFQQGLPTMSKGLPGGKHTPVARDGHTTMMFPERDVIAACCACDTLSTQMNFMVKNTIEFSQVSRVSHIWRAAMTSLPRNVIAVHTIRRIPG